MTVTPPSSKARSFEARRTTPNGSVCSVPRNLGGEAWRKADGSGAGGDRTLEDYTGAPPACRSGVGGRWKP